MNHALICVDNLRVGGYQRLALDEAYALSDRGYIVSIFVLEESNFSTTKINTFFDIESGLISSKNIEINFSSQSWLRLLVDLRHTINSIPKSPLIISHSLRCTAMLKLFKLFYLKRQMTINTKIHQLPSLTDPKQRLKRLIYSQFTDYLFGFSEAVRVAWATQFGNQIHLLLQFTKKIDLLRNGIYLDRLPVRDKLSLSSNSRPRIIFLGRLTFWKGLSIFETISLLDELKDYDFLFIIPSYVDSDFWKLKAVLGDRLKIVEGRSINQLQFYEGDVHLYPALYGKNSKVIESISLNCLEMACLGIPSLVTVGGQITWPEQVFKKVFLEVDWDSIDQVVSEVGRASNLKIQNEDLELIRRKIDINSELDRLIRK
jgi:hypothetical protein